MDQRPSFILLAGRIVFGGLSAVGLYALIADLIRHNRRDLQGDVTMFLVPLIIFGLTFVKRAF